MVQPLLGTELVFMLVLRRFWIRQSIRPVTWVAATVTCVGLAVLACCAAAAVLAVLARWGSPGLRAALYASASAVMWALVATFIKATTDTLTQFGVGGTPGRCGPPSRSW